MDHLPEPNGGAEVMSTENANASLTDFITEQTVDSESLREQALDGGARYRSPPTTQASDAGEDLATSKHECETCGSTVAPAYHRGNSDNDGVLWHCLNCEHINQTDMKNGAGAKPDYTARIPDHGTRGGGL